MTVRDAEVVTTQEERLPALSPPVGRHPLVPLPDANPQAHPYAGLGTHAFTAAQKAQLLAAVDPATMLDVLPTGEVYMPQVHYRRVLNAVFGPGGWGMLPVGDLARQGNILCREFALIVQGQCLASAFGEQEYFPNGRMTWATAAEAAKSNALMRCCKDLGIASECWDKRFTEGFHRDYCVHVRVWNKKKGQLEWQWRRRDATPFNDEQQADIAQTAERDSRKVEAAGSTPAVGSEDEDLAAQMREQDPLATAREVFRAAGATVSAPGPLFQARPNQPKEADKPRDAISTPRLKRLYALMHTAVEAKGTLDLDQGFELVRQQLVDWLGRETGRYHLSHCPWQKYDALVAQIGPIVEAL